MPKLVEDKEYYEMLIKIGLNIAYYRKLNNLTQIELAEKASLSRTVISCIEAPDKHYGMALNTVYRIAKELGIPVRNLFDFRDERD